MKYRLLATVFLLATIAPWSALSQVATPLPAPDNFCTGGIQWKVEALSVEDPRCETGILVLILIDQPDVKTAFTSFAELETARAGRPAMVVLVYDETDVELFEITPGATPNEQGDASDIIIVGTSEPAVIMMEPTPVLTSLPLTMTQTVTVAGEVEITRTTEITQLIAVTEVVQITKEVPATVEVTRIVDVTATPEATDELVEPDEVKIDLDSPGWWEQGFGLFIRRWWWLLVLALIVVAIAIGVFGNSRQRRRWW